MPLINLSQFIGKTFVIKNPTPFYRVLDINKDGDKAQSLGKLKIGYSFRMDSYLQPREAGSLPPYPCPPLCYGKRDFYYFTFKGNDGNMYGVRYLQDQNQFDSKVLREQGVKTVEETRKEDEENLKPWYEKLGEQLGKDFKKVLLIGIGVIAIGYLLPKINKK